jgi:hypothetical protein
MMVMMTAMTPSEKASRRDDEKVSDIRLSEIWEEGYNG